MYRLFLIAACLFFLACDNSSTQKDKIVTIPEIPKVIPGVPPSTVTGTFTGQLPCADCAGIEVMLRLTDSTFWRFQNIKSAKDKKHSLQADKGKCLQEHRIITLYKKNGISESYKIISNDSILLISSKIVSRKSKDNNYFLRKK